MHAEIGDRLLIHGRSTGRPTRGGTVVAVHGSAGSPPYVVHFDDGHETLVYPGGYSTIVERVGQTGWSGGAQRVPIPRHSPP